MGSGRLVYVSINGYYWSATTSTESSIDTIISDASVYSLYFASILNPSRGPYGRWNGFPLRRLSVSMLTFF